MSNVRVRAAMKIKMDKTKINDSIDRKNDK